MKIVIDTNRIMAAIIRGNLSRVILFSEKFEFFMPEYAINEILKYKNELCNKAMISSEEFDILFSLILQRISVIPRICFEKFMGESENLIKDRGDVPFIALCIAIRADGIWTEDQHFFEHDKIKVFRTSDMIKLL